MGHFYFIRHGQTVWNVENKICGATDSPLTEYGREQAKKTGQKILTEGVKADEILCSPLSRAADTARLISEMTGILPIKKLKTQSALNNFDEFTMLSSRDFAP